MTFRSISIECGRLRRAQWLVQLGVAVVGGWVWFGAGGAVLMGLWAFGWKPQRTMLIALPHRPRRIKLSRYAVTAYWGWHCVRIYRDELPEDEFARLRREWKESLN